MLVFLKARSLASLAHLVNFRRGITSGNFDVVGPAENSAGGGGDVTNLRRAKKVCENELR